MESEGSRRQIPAFFFHGKILSTHPKKYDKIKNIKIFLKSAKGVNLCL